MFDMPTGCGSKLWANSYARRDATCVARLRQAGAVILGKTVTTAVRQLRPAGDAQPVEPRPHPRRQFQRLGRGGGVRHVPGGAGHADRRLDHPPGELLRRVQPEADLRPGERGRRAAAGPEPGPRRRDGELRAGFGDPAPAHRPHRRGRSSEARFTTRQRSRNPGRECFKQTRSVLPDFPAAAGPEMADAFAMLREANDTAAGWAWNSLPLPPAFADVPCYHHTLMAVEAADVSRRPHAPPPGRLPATDPRPDRNGLGDTRPRTSPTRRAI